MPKALQHQHKVTIRPAVDAPKPDKHLEANAYALLLTGMSIDEIVDALRAEEAKATP